MISAIKERWSKNHGRAIFNQARASDRGGGLIASSKFVRMALQVTILAAGADFVVLDYRSTPILDLRLKRCTQLADKLFVLAILGDDRAVKATYVLGKEDYCRK